MRVNQNRPPNFRVHEKLYLVRCFACPDAGPYGMENYLPMAATGTCAWCGWKEGVSTHDARGSDQASDIHLEEYAYTSDDPNDDPRGPKEGR